MAVTTPTPLFEKAIQKALEKEVQDATDKLIDETLKKARIRMQEKFVGTALTLARKVDMYYNHSTLKLELTVPESWGLEDE